MNCSVLELLPGQVDRELKVKETNAVQWRSALLQPIICLNDATSTDNINCDTGKTYTVDRMLTTP
jgi:hypothetical protein